MCGHNTIIISSIHSNSSWDHHSCGRHRIGIQEGELQKHALCNCSVHQHQDSMRRREMEQYLWLEMDIFLWNIQIMLAKVSVARLAPLPGTSERMFPIPFVQRRGFGTKAVKSGYICSVHSFLSFVFCGYLGGHVVEMEAIEDRKRLDPGWFHSSEPHPSSQII